jgi:hypothetical protein
VQLAFVNVTSIGSRIGSVQCYRFRCAYLNSKAFLARSILAIGLSLSKCRKNPMGQAMVPHAFNAG